MHRLCRHTLTLIFAAITVTSCGQSGPLYLPGNPSEVQATPPAAPEAADDVTGDEADKTNTSENES